ALLREVLPADLAPTLDAGQSLSFTLPTPDGDLAVRVAYPGGVLEVSVGLGGDPGPEPDLTAVQSVPEPPVFTPGPAAPGAVPAGLARGVPVAPPLEVLPPPGVAVGPGRAPEARPVVEFPPDYLPGLLRAALAAPASDVHLEAGSRPWARVGGEVQPLDYG